MGGRRAGVLRRLVFDIAYISQWAGVVARVLRGDARTCSCVITHQNVLSGRPFMLSLCFLLSLATCVL